MKNITLATILALALIPSLVAAEATSSDRKPILDRVRDLKPEIKPGFGVMQDGKTLKEIQAERKGARVEIKKKLWNERIAFARTRIGVIRAHISRLEKVAERLQQVAGIRESAGVNVSNARAKIASATASLATAKTQLETVITNFPTEKNASTTPGATVSSIQKSLTEVVALIKSAHQDLVDAWQILKPVKAPVTEEATSTASST